MRIRYCTARVLWVCPAESWHFTYEWSCHAAVRLAGEKSPVSTSPFTKLLHIKVITFCSAFTVKYGSMTTLVKNLYYIYIHIYIYIHTWTVRNWRKCLFRFLCSRTWTALDYSRNFASLSDLAGITSITIKFRASLIVDLHFVRW